MKRTILIVALLLTVLAANAQQNDKILYIVDGQVTAKADVDAIPADNVKNMNVVKGVEQVVLITTDGKVKQKLDDVVVVSHELKGSMLRVVDAGGRGDKVKADPMFIIKKADGTLDRADNLEAFSPNDIKTITVLKDGADGSDQFKKFGDTSNGVIVVELK
ncbi:MAG: hypothetical protein IJX65_02125 [Alistipes sp.]|nr:hypothetical protein [Alistipes sp.]